MELLSIIYYLAFLIGLRDAAFGEKIIFSDENASLTDGLNVYNRNRNRNRRSPPKEDDACFTETGKKGECLRLNQCPELLDYIKSRNGIHTPGTMDYLKSRVCKITYRTANVCCVTKTTTLLSPFGVLPRIGAPQPSNVLLPSMDECGLGTVLKVRRGKEFIHGTHPWLVGVGYPKDNHPFTIMCGGTLITKKHVLTAAHCFHQDERTPAHKKYELTHVILGEHSLSKAKEREQPIILRIAEKKNPGYNYTIHYNDISLLVLEKEITFTKYIRPACLPLDSYIEHFDLSKSEMTVAGWGHTDFGKLEGTDEPLEARLSLVPKSECRKAYNFAKHIPLDDTQLCLAKDGKDTCEGDSGGPLLYWESTKFYRQFVVGVVAFGGGCGSKIHPGVYTYVPKYVPWILNNLH